MSGRLLARVLVVPLLAAVGCAHQPLLRIEPAALGPARTVQQRVQYSRGDTRRTLELVLDHDALGLHVVGSAFGMRLFTLVYDGRTVRQQAGGRLPQGLSPTRVVNGLLLVFAPESGLRRALGPDWALRGGPDGRTLAYRGRPLIEVRHDAADPLNGRSTLHHLRLGYRLVIDSAAIR